LSSDLFSDFESTNVNSTFTKSLSRTENVTAASQFITTGITTGTEEAYFTRSTRYHPTTE